MYLVAMLFGHNANIVTALLFSAGETPNRSNSRLPPSGLTPYHSVVDHAVAHGT